MIYIYLAIWVVGSVFGFFLLSGLMYHAVNYKTAMKRVITGLTPRNIFYQQHWAVLGFSTLWLVFLPGLLLAMLFHIEGIMGNFRKLLVLTLFNLPYWALLVWLA